RCRQRFDTAIARAERQRPRTAPLVSGELRQAREDRDLRCSARLAAASSAAHAPTRLVPGRSPGGGASAAVATSTLYAGQARPFSLTCLRTAGGAVTGEVAAGGSRYHDSPEHPRAVRR